MLLVKLAKVLTKACVVSVATKQVMKTAANLSVRQGTNQTTKQAAIKSVAAEATKSKAAQVAVKLVAAEATKSGRNAK